MKRFAFVVTVVLALAQPGLAQISNVVLDEWEGSHAETAVALNPKNPLNMVAISSLGDAYVTIDGGLTWKKNRVKSSYGHFGSPVILCDTKGTYYYFHLSDVSGKGLEDDLALEVIVCHVSYDGGITWDTGTPVGFNAPKDELRPRATLDSKNNVWLTWTQFDKYDSDHEGCTSRKMVSYSSGGKKWSKPVEISQLAGDCRDGSLSPAPISVSDDKKIFVAWAQNNQILLDRSFNGGDFWLSNDINIVEGKGGWNFKLSVAPWAGGMPAMAIDRTKSNHNGLLFLAWADLRNGKDNSDVWMIRSNNFGDIWTPALKVNEDLSKKHQFMPVMSIDNSTGTVYIVYFEAANSEDATTDVYLAYSRDSGTRFNNVKINESPVDTRNATGLSLSLSAHKGVVVPAWTSVDQQKVKLITAIINEKDLPQ